MQGESRNTYPVTMQLSNDGRLTLISKARDGADVSAYYRNVSEFTAFDFSGVQFDYDALSE